MHLDDLISRYRDSFLGLKREVWYLSLVTLINRAGTMVIPFLALYLTDKLDFTYAQVGWVMTAFGAGSMGGAWLGGRLTDRIGYYPVLVISLIGTGLAFIALQYVQGFWAFCAAIFAIMVIADSFRPAGLVAINAYSKPENRTRSVTLIRLAINLGFSFGPALGGFIIVSAGYNGLFWIDGFTCIAAAMIVLALLPARQIATDDEEFVHEEVTTASSAYTDRPYWLLLTVAFFMGFAFMQLFSTVPLFYREVHGLSENIIGWLLAMNGAVIFVLEMPLVYYFENKKWPKIRVVQLSCVLMAVSYLLLNVHPAAMLLVVSMLFITVGEMLGFPFTNAMAMNRAPNRQSGQYLALYTMSFSAAHLVGPNIGMQLTAQLGFDVCWYVMAGIALLAAVLGVILEGHWQVRNTEVN